MEARAVVSHNVTPMRAEPRDRSEQVSQAIFGETVRLLREDGEYTEIQTPDSYQGWALTRHLSVLETAERYPDPTRAALVTPLISPVFREPTARSERLTLLTLGTVVELAAGDSEADFYPIRFPDRELGFVESGALIIPDFPPADRLGPNLVVVARAFIGIPYLWGGRTPFGIDCSGFVQRVYWLNGRVIPRDAYLQANADQFEPAEKPELVAGDLIFFSGRDSPHGRVITHVGMSLGDNRFIHASGKLGVAISPLDDPQYVQEYWGARRMRG